jgi:hypothetical protein
VYSRFSFSILLRANFISNSCATTLNPRERDAASEVEIECELLKS